MGKHRQDEGYGSRTEPTQILPIVKRRMTASPLLLAAGGVALTLVLGVGGWALLGRPSGGDPLVFPWSADKPSDIDVSVSMVPTSDPTQPPSPSPSRSPARSRPKRAAGPPSPGTLLSPVVTASASRSPNGVEAIPLTASVIDYGGWSGNVLVNIEVRNRGTTAVTWTVELWFDKDVHSNTPWNAKVDAISDRHLKFTAVRTLGAGDTVRFGFIAGYSGRTQPDMVSCKVDGRDFPCDAR